MREILIEKYTEPDYTEGDEERILQHWYNREGWCERKNNLPAIVVMFRKELLLHYHKNGYWVKSKIYDSNGNDRESNRYRIFFDRVKDRIGANMNPST